MMESEGQKQETVTSKQRRKMVMKTAFLVFLVCGTILIVRQQHTMAYRSVSGLAFGTVYNITYQSDKDLKTDIENVLAEVDGSLSPFNDTSVISRINRNEDVEPDKMFMDVFTLAQKVSAETDGAFDITVAPLVNAWGFGFKGGTEPTRHVTDSLRRLVGYKKLSYEVENGAGRIRKADPRMMLDCSAIAKGYGSDMVGRMLRSKGVENYMVEIGGEVVTAGVNAKRVPWRIGITKPDDDSLGVSRDVQAVLNVTETAIATSGNYRNYYIKDGKKYAHTIDPTSGCPVQHSILSSTVIAEDCATADAYATAFMVMGMEKAQDVLARRPEIKAYFIYADEKGDYAVWHSPGLELTDERD